MSDTVTQLSSITQQLIVRDLGLVEYATTWQAMQRFTDNRDETSADEIWLLEHHPVFTQGQAGKAEHLLNTGDIPVVEVDRGGQVTYHGPGQLVVYLLIDIRRRKLGVRNLVTLVEDTIVDVMALHGINAAARADAPGVYVSEDKVCSLGLRIRKGCSFHGLAFNVDTDLSPFSRINPCGYAGMKMVNSRDLGGPNTIEIAKQQVVKVLKQKFSVDTLQYRESINE